MTGVCVCAIFFAMEIHCYIKYWLYSGRKKLAVEVGGKTSKEESEHSTSKGKLSFSSIVPRRGKKKIGTKHYTESGCLMYFGVRNCYVCVFFLCFAVVLRLHETKDFRWGALFFCCCMRRRACNWRWNLDPVARPSWWHTKRKFAQQIARLGWKECRAGFCVCFVLCCFLFCF